MENVLTKEKLEKYFDVTGRAKQKVFDLNAEKIAKDMQLADAYDMVCRYYADAEHFFSKDDYINAFAALNYAHGWLDCLARLGIIDVKGDDVLFTVDSK
ncbi:MAG: DUF357 domain-containing protein [Candidatus Woesearchaeota archaeon]